MDAYEPWLRGRVALLGAGRLGDAEREHAVQTSANVLAGELREFLATDVDEQRMNPLQIIRRSTAAVAGALRAAGVAAPQRDEFEQRGMPEDPYAIGPVAWLDLGETVHETGITWGAWKAATVLTRRRPEGKP